MLARKLTHNISPRLVFKWASIIKTLVNKLVWVGKAAKLFALYEPSFNPLQVLLLQHNSGNTACCVMWHVNTLNVN